MADELQPMPKLGELDLEPYAANVVQVSSFKEGALSRLSDDDLQIVAGKLYGMVRVLVNLFARHANIDQIQRMGPSIATLLKTLDSKMKEPVDGKMLMGGGESDISDMWTQAFQKAQSGGNPPGTDLALRTGAPAAAPAPGALAAPIAPGAMSLAPAAAPGALATPGAPASPEAMLAAAQAMVYAAQAQQVQLENRRVEGELQVQEMGVELAKSFFDQAKPMSEDIIHKQAVVYSVVVEGALVALLFLAGKGVAGLGLIGAVAGIQLYSAVSHFSASRFLQGLGTAVGGAVLSVGTGIGGGIANALSSAIGLGPVTGAVEAPTIVSATGQPEDSVLVEGRGFTPGVAMSRPMGEMSLPEMRTLMQIQDLSTRVDRFIGALFTMFFGEFGWIKASLGTGCVASVAFLMIYYCVVHLLGVMDDAKIAKRRMQGLDMIRGTMKSQQQSTPPSFLPSPLYSLFGYSQPEGQQMMPGAPGRRQGGKKRRTFRKTNARATRHKKKATKVLGTPVLIY